jgi:hypothetical protein
MPQQLSDGRSAMFKIGGRLLLAIAAVAGSGFAGYLAMSLSGLSDWGAMGLCDSGCPTDDGFGNTLGQVVLVGLGVQVAVGLVWTLRGGAWKLLALIGIPAVGVIDFLSDFGGHTLVTPDRITHSPERWLKLWLFLAFVAAAALTPLLAGLFSRHRRSQRTAEEFA